MQGEQLEGIVRWDHSIFFSSLDEDDLTCGKNNVRYLAYCTYVLLL